MRFEHITNEDGLSNSTIECIVQDQRGFMWFGTRDGLNRYDGYDVTIFRHDPNDEHTLSDDYINCVFEDSKGDLWIGTKNGLNYLDVIRQEIKRVSPLNGITNTNIITSIIEEDGRLLISTYGDGIKEINLNGDKNDYISSEMQIRDLFVNDMVSSDGRIWFATDSGLCLWRQREKQAEYIDELKGIDIKTIKRANDNSLWLGTAEAGVYHYHPHTKRLHIYQHRMHDASSLASNQVRALTIDNNSDVWIGSINGGISRLDRQTDAFVNYQHEPGNPQSLSQRTVSALFQDVQGNMWIGTHRGGVNLYSPSAKKFNLVRQTAKKNSLSYNNIKTFYEDEDGNTWIGTDGEGISIWNKKRNHFTYLKNDVHDGASLGSDAVLHIMADSNGELFVSTWGGGLNVYRPSSKTFKRFLHDKRDRNTIGGNFVQQTFEDSKGNFWVGTYYNGLYLFDRKKQTFTRFFGKEPKNELSGNNIVSIAEDDLQNLWIGTDDGGLNKYDLETEKIKHYFVSDKKKPDLRVIFQDRKKRIWIGQRGLYVYDGLTDNFKLFSDDDELAKVFIKAILEDDEGFLWISTSNGIIKLDPDSDHRELYNLADGLQGSEFEPNAALKTKMGEMFFGGINGFNHFYPKDIITNTYVPPLYLTDFQIFNETISPKSAGSPLDKDISWMKRVELSHRQSTFSIGFSALNYVASENNKYEYMLEGLDKSWRPVSTERKAYYTNVPPGRLEFKVRASNNDNVWNDGISLAIVVKPPFWDTWWFKILAISIVAYLLFLLLNFRRKIEIRTLEQQKKEEIHQMQLQFFTNIAHELRTPLTLIAGPIEHILKEDNTSKFRKFYHSIQNNTNRLVNLVDELMDFRKAASGHVKLKTVSLQPKRFLERIKDEFQDVAEEKGIKFSVVNRSKKEKIWIDAQILERITLNLLINAIKYTAAKGKVTLEINDECTTHNPELTNRLSIQSEYRGKEYFYLKVTDTGIGISKDSISRIFERYFRVSASHIGSGIGLAFVKSLAVLHKASIYVNSEKNIGTEFIIAFPSLRAECKPTEQAVQIAARKSIRLENAENQHVNETTVYPNEWPNGGRRKKILIVDDNAELRTFVKDVLVGGYIIFEAINGEDGLLKAKETYPDLIISDVMMPKVNGNDFCRKVKNDIDISHIPFLILTAKTGLEAEMDGKESGADHYLTKPINVSLLTITLRNIFEQQEKLKERYQKNHQVEAKELVTNAKDKDFLERLLDLIDENLTNTELDIEFLCAGIGMSRTKLYQKVKDITGQSIGEFIRTVRLRKAVKIMSEEDVPLSDVIHRIGIQTQSYFTRIFKKEFNTTPRKFLQELEEKKHKSILVKSET